MDPVTSFIYDAISNLVPDAYKEQTEVIVILTIVTLLILVYILLEKFITLCLNFMWKVLSAFLKVAKWLFLIYIFYVCTKSYLSTTKMAIPEPISSGFETVTAKLSYWGGTLFSLQNAEYVLSYGSNVKTAYHWIVNKTIG